MFPPPRSPVSSPPPRFRTIDIVVVPEDPFGLIPDPMDSLGGTQHWWDPDEDYVVDADYLPICSNPKGTINCSLVESGVDTHFMLL